LDATIIDVDLNTAKRHDAVTLGTANGLSLAGQELALSIATESSAGAMSASDKAKLNASGFVVLPSDVTNASADVLADVTGLSFSVVSGSVYRFRFEIWYTSSDGTRWAINGPAFSDLSSRSNYAIDNTSETVNNGLDAYDLPAAANAGSVSGIAIVEGFVSPSAIGSVIARFASDVSVTAKAGSMVHWTKVS
jgi:hypothetical protein